MKNDLKTTGNRLQKSLISKLRNQFWEIPLMRVARSILQTNISAAC